MSENTPKAILHNSKYDLSMVAEALTSRGYEIITGRYFAEIMRKLNGEDVVAGYAVVGAQDDSGIEFLRSLMEYNLVTQRILLTPSNNTEIYKKVINRSHVHYVLDYPAKKDEIELYIRKIERRYKRINKPFLRFSALSEVTEDLLTLNEKYREEASTDTLTNLFNRRTFDSFLIRYWERWINKKISFCLAFIDLDFFKKVNDTYGHTVGDLVLRVIADIFNSNKRTGIDFAFRYGGEEFAIISAAINEMEMELYIKRLNRIVKNTDIKVDENNKINITISAGVCLVDRCDSKQSIVDHADASLYEAKANGRDQVIVYKK